MLVVVTQRRRRRWLRREGGGAATAMTVQRRLRRRSDGNGNGGAVMGVAVVAVAVAVAVVHRPPLFACGCSSAAPDPSSLCTCSAAPHRLVCRCPPLFVTDVRDVFSFSTHFQRRNSLQTDRHQTLFISSSWLLSCKMPSSCVGYLFFLSSSWLLSCNTPLSRVGYLFFLSSCWIQTSFPLISSVLYPPQCSRIAMMIHFIISILYVPQ